MPANYEKPYRSKRHDAFAWSIHKHLSDTVSINKESTFQSTFGEFTVDFIIQDRNRKIGITIRETDPLQDNRNEWEDAVLVGSGFLDAVYNFPNVGIDRYLNGCLAALAIWEPNLFDDRGRINLETLAPEVVSQARNKYNHYHLFIAYHDLDGSIQRFEGIPQGFNIFGVNNLSPKETFWRDIFQFAIETGGDLDSVISRWRRSVTPTKNE